MIGEDVIRERGVEQNRQHNQEKKEEEVYQRG